MKNSFKLFLAAAAFVGFASNASAQATDNASATAYARIIAPINVESNGSALQFGSMVSSASGTVTVSTAGARTASGVITVNQGATPTAAGFTVTGEPSYIYNITLPTSATILNQTDLTTTMTVNAFTASGTLQHTLSGLGTDNFTVGGDLNVVGGEAAGLYQGTFSVTVTYN